MQLPVSTYDNEDPTSTSRLINCYAEGQPAGARSPVVLRKCPGLKQHDTSSVATWQGIPRIFKKFPGSNDFLLVGYFTQSGTSLIGYGEESQVSAAAWASQPNIAEWVDCASDQNSIVFVSEPSGYRITESAGAFTVTAISDSDFTARGAADVEFLDNYFLFREPGTARFFGSDVGAPTAYTSTNFATAEAAGDLLVGMKATRANLILFGEETAEIWDAVGGGAFPFRRIINGAIDKGCINGRTIAEIDDQVLWVADDKTVRILNGMEPAKVSNFAIDSYLEDKDGLSDGAAFTYTFAGHNYYVLRFSDRCFVYDLTTGLWHERKTLGIKTWAYGLSESIWGRQWFCRDLNPEIYKGNQVQPFGYMSDDAYHEIERSPQVSSSFMDNIPMVMSWTYQPVWGSGQRVFHDRLEIVVQTGVGNSDETDPVISLEASDDGGQTWQSLPDRAMGAQGKTFQRVVWHNLGSSYQRVYRASVSAPVPVRVMSTELTARGGRV